MVDAANALLSKHPLSAVRLQTWEPSRHVATFEVFHLDWPKMVYGVLRFGDVAYLQCPTVLSWGVRASAVAHGDSPLTG